ncbi:sigma-70 family RNA polymerase sigma factor, partial [Parabacteroides sp. Marseille-P3160]
MIDPSHFETIYKEWSGKVYNFIIGLSNGNQYLAEEIVQSTFLKVWENRQNIDLEKNAEAYIYTIAKNQLYNYFSREELKALYNKSQEQRPSEAGNASEKHLDYQILVKSIQSIVAQMPPSRRKIFL